MNFGAKPNVTRENDVRTKKMCKKMLMKLTAGVFLDLNLLS